MVKLLYLDTETFSPVPLANGTDRYAEVCEIMVVVWAFNDGPVHCEDLTASPYRMSQELLDHIHDPEVTVVMHNSWFDRTVLGYHQVHIPVERTHDTMIRAMAHSLPGGLDKLCGIFKLGADVAKHKEGKALIQLFCKPLPKNQNLRRATRETHPEKWAEFLDYAISDITSMRILYRDLPKWNYTGIERKLWELDQRINQRGVCVDLELAETAVTVVKAQQAKIKKRVQDLTDYEGGIGVQSATQRDAMLRYILSEHGVSLPDMKKDTLERRLADPELPEGLRLLLGLRLAATTTSTTKYAALMRAASEDGRLRGAIQFAGALRTGRRAGRIFQPQNLPRPKAKASVIEQFIADLKVLGEDMDLAYTPEQIIALCSDSLRGSIIADEGKRLFSSDLSNIEGRVAAWLAGEEWKLQAFRDFDTVLGYDKKGEPIRKGHDLYAIAYAASFHVTPESVMIDKKNGGEQRQVGKVQELFMQYEGGVGAFITGAMVYRIDLENMAATAYPLLPDEARQKAEGMLQWRRKKKMTTYGLSDRTFVVCEAFKSLWRAAHPQISSYWAELFKAACQAVLNPGQTFIARRLKFKKDGAWLRMIKPSGASVCYPSPRLEGDKLTYLGVDQYTRQWKRIGTYGGKIFENACQSVARDVMFYNELLIEEAGFEIVLDVHDDVIAEADDDRTDLTSDYLSSLLATNPPWLPGCPLAAGGFEAQRYRKD